MISNEPALRAVRMQVQFELAQAAADVARAATLREQTQQRLVAARQRCEWAASELRGVLQRARLDPTLLAAMHRLHQVEQQTQHLAQARLTVDERREEQARAVLAGVRNRERSLQRALQAEQQQRRAALQLVEMLQADELWLQHAARQPS